MGNELASEVLGNRPRRPTDEWVLLLALACRADDRTRQVAAYGLKHLGDMVNRDENVARQSLADLHATDLLRTVTPEDGSGCTVYEIQPIPQWSPPAKVPERTALYRIFGDADLLLYIGISKNFGTRWKQHAKVQPWWDEHRRMTVEWRDSRPEAEEAETAAIEAEHPKYNIAHNVTAIGAGERRMQPEATVVDNLDEVVLHILATPQMPPAEIRIALAQAIYGSPPDDVPGFVKYAMRAGVGRQQAYQAASRRELTKAARKAA